MKKFKIVGVLVCLLVCQTVCALPITREQAQARAEQFLSSRSGSRRLSPVAGRGKKAPRRALKNGNELYYVFNRGEGEGFVIVAGDDQIDGVLGYTDAGDFDYDAIPDNMRAWLDDYAGYVEYLQESPSQTKRRAATHKAIAPMMTTTWNQGNPYNQACPNYFDLGRSVTGCVATAMAQILYYERARSVTETQADMPGYTAWAEKPYKGQYLEVEGIPAGSPIDWDHMKNSYNGDGSGATAQEKKAVADLMHYCGVSVQMGYTNASSGAQSSDVVGAMKTYFGYGESVQMIYLDNYGMASFDAKVYNELENGRAVYLSGYNSEGGHAFVTDGHDGTYYHINWGWGGGSDGYYRLDSLKPGDQGIGGTPNDAGGYSSGLSAIIGCEPENYMDVVISFENATAKRACVAAFDSNNDGKLTYGEAAAVTDLGDVLKGSRMTSFDELYYFTGLTEIADDAFNGCTSLKSVKLPKGLKRIGARAFAGCQRLNGVVLPEGLKVIDENAFDGCAYISALTLPSSVCEIGAGAFRGCLRLASLELPMTVETVGAGAFSDCNALKSFTLRNPRPQALSVSTTAFEGTDLSDATLYVIQGMRAYFAATEPWQAFGCIQELRDWSRGHFAELETNTDFYLYHVGTGHYLTRGEAYGTQAVVGEEPQRFQLRRSSGMAEGVYYLYTDENDITSRHWLFRTSNDGRLGTGIKGCFVDGTSLTSASYWKVTRLPESDDALYTFQIPSNVEGYVLGEYMGVDLTHDNNNQTPTYGVFSDVSYVDAPRNCQWALVRYDAAFAEQSRAAKVLAKLLKKASAKSINTVSEQAVYDCMESSVAEIEAAQYTLRKKLGLMNFKDPAMRTICQTLWDMDDDGELSYNELAVIDDVKATFMENTSVTSLEDLEYFTGLKTIKANSFQKCTNVTSLRLPKTVQVIENYAFNRCSKLESVELPDNVYSIGSGAFTLCSAMKSVTVSAANPADIKLTGTVFSSTYVKDATLYVPFGSKELYAEADQWKNFGNIQEVRTHIRPSYSPVEADVPGYLYNQGMHGYVTHGEAYGTQAVVGDEGVVYQFKAKAGSENVYTLETSESNPYLFRTTTDSKIGKGVKGCFYDGPTSKLGDAYWQVASAEGAGEHIFTLQVPATDASYTEGEYLGVQTSHVSEYTTPTYGLYWDIALSEGGANCHWAFIRKADVEAVEVFNALGDELKRLLAKADAKGLDVAAEHAVYDDPAATNVELSAAAESVRSKLGYIAFLDEHAEVICVNEWDADHDGYLSYEEAAAVTELGEAFRSASGMKSMDELRYFTSLTAIPNNAFASSSSLVSLYLPAQVTSIGSKAFHGCSNLRYIAIPSAALVPDASNTSLTERLTVFVPEEQVAAFQEDASWSVVTVKPYTGIPVVTASDVERGYGDSSISFIYEVDGAPINGNPSLTCDVTVESSVGTYPIQVSAGNVTTPDVQFINGNLRITKAPLSIKVRPATREMGQENPEFKVRYSGWKNGDREEVLLALPKFECEADENSPAGEYVIRAYGVEAENYEPEYVDGVLTITAPDGIYDIANSKSSSGNCYDLSGRRVTQPRRGVYIVDGKKQVR